eukprot:CAMPEP_0119402918 /NCGR_PEP_ID=MMETSP1334-20130426/143124_1 /TAXON_ID=127549 /ORGANISM="Calcidiscus leptoporus, Strain RCC1130" /LENGTH=287 /DNA_ID=CAMNT_0007426857 /DNA_START=410 /DNA_END=1270 /DNA_ORIENTATION=-
MEDELPEPLLTPFWAFGSDGVLTMHAALLAKLRTVQVSVHEVQSQLDAARRTDPAHTVEFALPHAACASTHDESAPTWAAPAYRELPFKLLRLVRSLTPNEFDIDILLDALLRIDEARILPALRACPLSRLRVYDHEHTHFFRPPAESYSPYAELLRVIDLVPRAGTLLDLGSGMGRAAMAALLVRRDVHYIGYEVVLERVRVANDALARMGAGGRVRVFCRRLGHRGRLKLPSLEDNSVVIFMFNPFAPATLRHMLAQLRVWATKHRFIIVFKAMAEELAAEHRVW